MSFLKVINLYKNTLKRKLLKDIPLSLISDNLKMKYPDINIDEDSLVAVDSLNGSSVPLYIPNSLNLYMFESLFYKDGKDTGDSVLRIRETELNNLLKLRAITLGSLGYKVNIEYTHGFIFMIERKYGMVNERDSTDIKLSFPLYYINHAVDEHFYTSECFQKSIVKTIFELLDFSTLSEEEYLYLKENCITE